MGLLLAVVVRAANIQDRDGAKLTWADAGYAGQLVDWAWAMGG